MRLGKSYDHRKRWLEERLETLAGIFGTVLSEASTGVLIESFLARC
jgi:hypothetical protein